MKQIYAALILGAALLVSGLPLQGASPLAGRWDITVATAHGTLVDWLGVTEKNGGAGSLVSAARRQRVPGEEFQSGRSALEPGPTGSRW
jgi:hypothetical protein